MSGEEALAAFGLAKRLLAEGKIEEARALKLLPSDRKILNLDVSDD